MTITINLDAGEPGDPAADLRDLAAGRPATWARCHQRHLPMLRARTRRYGLQEADALDAIQTTWLRLAANVHLIHTPEHLAGWLATTVSRECLRILRARSRTIVDEAAVEEAYPAAPPVDEEVVARLLADADRTALAAALRSLSPRQRRLLLALFSDDQRSYAQVAQECGMPVGSIGPTRARSLAHLRVLLAEQRTSLSFTA